MNASATRVAGLAAKYGVVVAALIGLGCERAAEHSAGGDAPAEIVWRKDHDAALASARADQKPALIDFTASWCAPCVRLEKETFSDPRVRSALQRFVTVRVDGSRSIEAVHREMDQHGVGSFPTLVFIDSKGVPMSSPRFDDFVGADQLLEALAQVR